MAMTTSRRILSRCRRDEFSPFAAADSSPHAPALSAGGVYRPRTDDRTTRETSYIAAVSAASAAAASVAAT